LILRLFNNDMSTTEARRDVKIVVSRLELWGRRLGPVSWYHPCTRLESQL